MKQFFISLLATITGIIISVFLLVLIAAGIIAAIISSASDDKPISVKNNSVLHLKLDYPIEERTSKNPFERFDLNSFSTDQGAGLNDILENIKKAKEDDNVKGIYLDLTTVQAGIATIEEIRNALLEYKKSGKFITSYSEFYDQKTYYLASVADKLYLNPQGSLDIKGLTAQVLFFKGMLDKLEVDAQIFRHGKFKSAVEPFDMEKMSPANREQTMTYVTAIWDHMLQGISASRKISVSDLNKIADNILIRNAADAMKYKLVDDTVYKDQLIADLKQRLGVAGKDKINYTNFNAYTRAPRKGKREFSKEKIAVIYAIGMIQGGEGGDDVIGSERISKAIREARTDSTVKAVVLRVNSPGGSAIASDVIWREVLLTKKEKPIVVSMGDLAASGGYYISCAADAIIAQPNTITGSIGVFGIIPNAQKLFSNKLGIMVDTVNTNKFSDMGSVFRPVTAYESAVIQQEIEQIYTTFVSKVASGRKMTAAQIDSIGQGRVWSGIDAQKLGLVDELGGIEKAIELAAKKANLSNYRIISLPRQKDPLQQLLKEVSEDVEARLLKSELGEQYPYYNHLKQTLQTKGIQARMPYDVILY